MTIITRQAYHFEDLEIGMEASFAKTVSEADIVSFAEVTGDKNPVHLDADYAAKTIFKGTIAHGMLTAGYISAVFGMEMPGPGAIYVSQTLNFRAPSPGRPRGRQGARDGALPRQAPRPLRVHLLRRRQDRARRRSRADGARASCCGCGGVGVIPEFAEGQISGTQSQCASLPDPGYSLARIPG